MIGGRMGEKTDFEFRLGWDITSTHTGDGSGYFGVDAHLDIACTRSLNYTSFDEFAAPNKQYMILEGGSTDNPAGTGTVATLEIPCWGINDSYSSGSAQQSVEITVMFEGVSLFNFNQLGSLRWNLTCDAVEWFVNGVSQGRFTGLGNLLGTRLEPCGVPIFGLPPLISGAVAAHFSVSLPPYSYDVMQETEGPIYGGYRFRPTGSGTWITPDVEFASAAYPTLSCSKGSGNADGVVTGTNTWNCQIDAYDKTREIGEVAFPPGGGTEDYFFRQEFAGRSGWFVPIPKYPRTVIRKGYAPGEIVYRGGFPYTTIRVDRTCLTPATFPLGTAAESLIVVHPDYPEMHARIDAAAHSIDEPTTETIYSMRAAGVGEGAGQWVSALDLPGEPVTRVITDINEFLGGFSAGTEFPYRVGGRTVGTDPNLDMLGYLDWYDVGGWGNAHDQRVRYSIYWLHPAWSYFNVFEDWEVDGVPTSRESYWMKIGHQHIDHSQLPSAERTLERTTLISAPLVDGAIQNYIEDMLEIGHKTSFWGIPDFHILPVEPVATRAAIAGPTRYTLADCTASYGSDIQLTSTGAAVIKCKYDLASFTQSPFMYPSIAEQFELDWTLANVANCEVFLIGIDGSEIKIADAPGTYPWPEIGLNLSKYAGTWAIDYGAGLVADSGSDVDLTNGDSAAMMASNVRSISPGLLPGRTARYIEFRITVANVAVPVNLTYPVFHGPSNPPLPLPLARQASAQIYENGPGWLFGFTTHADSSSGIVNPPVIRDIGAQITTLDVLAFRNLVLLGESASNDVSSDLAAMYTVGEEYNVDENTAIDTVAFIAFAGGAPKFVMHNSYQMPPVWSFPVPARNAQLEPITGEYTMAPMSFSDRSRVLVGEYRAADEPRLYSDLGDLWTAPFPSVPDAWAVTVHTHAVANNESDFTIRRFGKSFALVRPWHGYFGIFGDWREGVATYGIKMCRDEHLGFIHAVIPAQPGVILKSWNERQGTERERTVTLDESISAGIAWNRATRKLVVVYDHQQPDDSIVIRRIQTDSQGMAWGASIMLWEGQGASNAFDSIGREFISYYYDGEFRIKYRRSDAESWQGPFTIVASADPGTTAIEIGPFATSPVVVVTSVELSGGGLEIRRFESYSFGKTWVETT